MEATYIARASLGVGEVLDGLSEGSRDEVVSKGVACNMMGWDPDEIGSPESASSARQRTASRRGVALR